MREGSMYQMAHHLKEFTQNNLTSTQTFTEITTHSPNKECLVPQRQRSVQHEDGVTDERERAWLPGSPCKKHRYRIIRYRIDQGERPCGELCDWTTAEVGETVEPISSKVNDVIGSGFFKAYAFLSDKDASLFKYLYQPSWLIPRFVQ